MMHQILWVDREPVAPELKAILERNQCSIDVALTAEQALRHLSESGYDCIITETELIDSTGFMLCRKIKKINDCPVVFYSRQIGDKDQKQAYQCGGDDYIFKPCDSELLWMKIIRRIEAHKDSAIKKQLIYYPLVIDTEKRKVTVGDKTLSMTVSEYNILVLLAASPNKIYAQNDIYKEIWGENDNEQPQTVQVHVSRIRRKLDNAYGKHEFIETVWGEGYRFNSPANNRRIG